MGRRPRRFGGSDQVPRALPRLGERRELVQSHGRRGVGEDHVVRVRDPGVGRRLALALLDSFVDKKLFESSREQT